MTGIRLDASVQEICVTGQTVFVVEDTLAACFDTPLTAATLDLIRERSPRRVVLCEGAFQGDESLRQNTLFNLRSAGTEVRIL
jgi:hypothetical protein